jgi:hypothetical protein
MHDQRVKFVTTASVYWIAPSTLMYKQLKHNQINDKKQKHMTKIKKKKKIQVCESNPKEDTVEKNETKKKRKLPVQ